MGRISIKVKRYCDLKRENSGIGDETSYLELFIRNKSADQYQKTKNYKNTYGIIEFNETFEFDIYPNEDLELKLKDSSCSSDDYIGYTYFTLGPAFNGQDFKPTLGLYNDYKGVGKIEIEATLIRQY